MTGKKTNLWGGEGSGNLQDDLDKVAQVLEVSKEQLSDAKQSVIQNIKVKKLIIKSGDVIDSIQFFYQVESNGKKYEVEGYRHGGRGGRESTINFGDDEVLMGMRGKYGSGGTYGYTVKVKYLEFFYFKGDIENIQITNGYGTWDGNLLNLGVSACFFSKSGDLLDSLGAHEGKMVDAEKEKLEADNRELKNNQEKHKPEDLEHHKPEDLSPADLPADWKKQLEDKKQLEKDLAQKNNDLIKALQDRGDLLKKGLDQQEEITNLTKKVNALEKQPTGGDSKPDPGLQKKYDDLLRDFNELKRNNQNARDYFQNLIRGKDDKISGLEGKLKQIATKLETDSNDPALPKKVEDLVDEVKALRAKVKNPETQKPSPSVPSSTTSNDTLQKQKQIKDDELQNYLKSLKSRLGSDYPENKIKDFLQTEIKLGRTGKKNAPESVEYQEWKSSRGALVEEGYLEETEINRLSQLQAEIVQLEIQIEKQLVTQVEAGNKG